MRNSARAERGTAKVKAAIASAVMAFAMFSVIPMPRVEWKKENMRYMLCCLPLIGVLVGFALWLWLRLCNALGFGNFLYAAGLALLPLFLSGGIHLDGFCDTVDALSSHAPPERKREILKDSRAGAFAVIFSAAYILLYAALASETPRTDSAIVRLGLHHVLARVAGALASVVLAPSGTTGMLATFHDAAQKRASGILIVWAVLCAAALMWLSPISGAVSVVLAALCFLYIRRMSAREFGGMSGDLAGHLITLTELVMLLGLILSERLTAIWF